MSGLLLDAPLLCGQVLFCYRPPSGGNSILTNAAEVERLCSAATGRYVQEAPLLC